jgi:hypothetical protein
MMTFKNTFVASGQLSPLITSGMEATENFQQLF